MRELKHLPVNDWPEADVVAFARAYEPGDIFDETAGPGAHLTTGTRRMITTAYRRWLGFLKQYFPDDLRQVPPADRINLDRVRTFVDHLAAEVKPTTVAIVIDNLCYAARLIAPDRNWRWLASIKVRLANRATPENRFDRLVPGWKTLDLGIELMENAARLHRNEHKQKDLQYRDGLILIFLSLWLPRRRSVAALTVSRHLKLDQYGANILLYPEDTKSKREESYRVPEAVLPYLTHYLKVVRPRLVGRNGHDGLWASYRGRPLIAGRIYDIARARVRARFSKDMGLHDFRRAGATFLATEAPEKIGLLPGILQHASPEVGEQHYNLAQSIEASRRFGSHLAKLRDRLKPIKTKD